RNLRRMGAASMAAVVVLIAAHLPLGNESGARAANYLAIASALSKDPAHTSDAAEFYRRALAEDDRFPAAHLGLGTLQARMGQTREAEQNFRAALRGWPDYAEAHYNLGAALAEEGRSEEAVQEYGHAIRLRPEDPDAHAALGKILLA